MSVAVESALTLDEFLAEPETKPAREFWDGQVRYKPMPMTKHSVIQTELSERINAAAKGQTPRRGRGLAEFRCTFAGRSVVPDIAYVRRERLPVDPDGRLANRFEAAPDLVVEIVSPDQSQFLLIEKLAWCMQNGVGLAWLIDPDAEQIMTFTPNSLPHMLGASEALEAPELLPGFRCPLAEVFGWLREQN